MNILYLYNATQTYTNTVYEHVAAFSKYSAFNSFFLHVDGSSAFNADLSAYDAVCIHYSIRLPFNQITESVQVALSNFRGLKFLFIQDEYDHTWRAWHWIKLLDIRLVFTVVPQAGVARIYPPHEFPGTTFVSVLTGYVPETDALPATVLPPSQRSLMVGYRGRPLPVRYGQLGFDKVDIGRKVKTYCDAHAICNDIAWSEESRVYGSHWNTFMASCRAMLGSESGSNVFDWDGTLVKEIAQFREHHPDADDARIYDLFVGSRELIGVMNQISPRVFEAIAAKTALVLFEGEYSGVIKPHEHFIALKKDASNIQEVMDLVKDGAFLDAMTARAYDDIIGSGAYSYQSFVQRVDAAIRVCWAAPVHGTMPALACANCPGDAAKVPLVTSAPIRALPPGTGNSDEGLRGRALHIWPKVPETIRHLLHPVLHRLLGKGQN